MGAVNACFTAPCIVNSMTDSTVNDPGIMPGQTLWIRAFAIIQGQIDLGRIIQRNAEFLLQILSLFGSQRIQHFPHNAGGYPPVHTLPEPYSEPGYRHPPAKSRNFSGRTGQSPWAHCGRHWAIFQWLPRWAGSRCPG